MKAYRSYLNLFFAFLSMPCALAMTPEADRDLQDPMEIDQPAQVNRPDRIATLRQTCLKYAVSHLPDFVINPQISLLAPDLRDEIYDRWMFGENPAGKHRHPSIIWLLAQCPITKCGPCQFDRNQLATPLVECNNMRIYRDKRSDGYIARVEDVQAQKGILEFTSEDPLLYAEFSRDGRYLFLAAKDKKTMIMSTQDWAVVYEGKLQSKLNYLKFSKLSPKSSAVICGSGSMIKLHDSITGDALCDFVRRSESLITEIGFSADGDRVIIRYDFDENVADENFLQDSVNTPTHPAIMADVYDISSANRVLQVLPILTLEQLGTIELLHKIAKCELDEKQLADAQVAERFNGLPEEIKVVVARFVPKMAQETALKRRKIDCNGDLE